MNKIVITIICVLILFVGQITCSIAGKLNIKNKDYVEIQEKKVFLSIASTDIELAKGLMFVDNLPEDRGMIFLFKDDDYRNFWMKNMKIPLDIVFIYKNKIGTIYNAVPPCQKYVCPIYKSRQKVDKVLELQAGFCKKYKIKEGDSIKYSGNVLSAYNKLRSGV